MEYLLHTFPKPFLWPLLWPQFGMLSLSWPARKTRLIALLHAASLPIIENRDYIFTLVSPVSSAVLIYSLWLINVCLINEWMIWFKFLKSWQKPKLGHILYIPSQISSKAYFLSVFSFQNVFDSFCEYRLSVYYFRSLEYTCVNKTKILPYWNVYSNKEADNKHNK